MALSDSSVVFAYHIPLLYIRIYSQQAKCTVYNQVLSPAGEHALDVGAAGGGEEQVESKT